jgi:translation initiation factor IF-1
MPADEFEKIASVTKLLGNGMFYAISTDGAQFLGHIRNKFKGRSRRHNDVIVGKLVLIGLRSWENPITNADLLFVYDDLDFNTISSKHDLSAFSLSNYYHDSLFDYDHINNNNTSTNTHPGTCDRFIADPSPSLHDNHSYAYDAHFHDI